MDDFKKEFFLERNSEILKIEEKKPCYWDPRQSAIAAARIVQQLERFDAFLGVFLAKHFPNNPVSRILQLKIN